ncbi:MAG: hypothetical protein P1V51_11905 [Deltaproteobacteria bacterium]|nr:hypothetical protein [Deltaproteobacteria bacterium]
MGERIHEELVYEYWDCAYCDSKAIRGDQESCTTCGHARDQDITFYRLEDREEQVEAEKQARHQAGADWICSFCNTLNAATLEACRNCSASKEQSEKNFLEHQAAKEAQRAPKPSAAPPPPPKKKSRLGLWLGLGAAAALIIGGITWATRTVPVTYEVTSVRWERSIPVERYQWVKATNWEDEMVGDDIRRLAQREKLHHTERRQVGTREETYTETQKVKTGTREECSTSYKSTGSGASKKVTKCRDVPVYTDKQVTKTRTVPIHKDFPIMKTEVDYQSKRYAPRDVARASGNDNAPQWPEAKLGTGEDGKPDREGKREALYLVNLKRAAGDKGPDTVELSTTEQRFTDVWKPGVQRPIGVSNLGGLSLEPGDETR